MFKLELKYKNQILFAKLKGVLDRKNSYKINNYLNYVIKKHGIKHLVYDWQELKMIDNYGLDALLKSKYYIKKNKGKIYVEGAYGSLEYLRRYLKIPKNECNNLVRERKIYKC